MQQIGHGSSSLKAKMRKNEEYALRYLLALASSAQTCTPNVRLKWEDLCLLLDIFIHFIPTPSQRTRRLPRVLRISQPQPDQMSLFIFRVCEPVARMENAQVVGKLHITFLEVERDGILLSQEMQRVERFSLGFGDGWNVGRARQTLETSECAASVLNY